MATATSVTPTSRQRIDWDRLRYEIRLIGVDAYLLPLAIAAIYLGIALVTTRSILQTGGSQGFAHFQVARILLALLENGLSLGIGLLAAAATDRDPAVELHLTLPARYRGTITRRISIIMVWALVVSYLLCEIVIATGYWVFPVDGIQRHLVWLTPLVCFAALGAVLTLLLRSRAASSGVLGMLWISQFLYTSQFIDNGVMQRLYIYVSGETFPGILHVSRNVWYAPWFQNRLILLGIALALFGGVALLLRRNEALLGHEQ
jgi:hypothetical protein